jgi:hypothetical protein
MVAIMRYAYGLKFTETVCENEETARKYLMQQGVPEYRIGDCYKIIPVAYVTKDLEIK